MPETYVKTRKFIRQLLFLEPCNQVEIYSVLEKGFLIKWALSGSVLWRGSCNSLFQEIISTPVLSGLGEVGVTGGGNGNLSTSNKL